MRPYTVKPGDCLNKIAHENGFADYRTIYDHPDNADFRRRRPNPNIIKAGDVLVIPDKNPKWISCETGKLHTFILNQPKTMLKLRVRNGGVVLSKRKYQLHLDGTKIDGRTTEEGFVEQEIPANATEAMLVFPDDGFSFELRIGALDPISELSGIKHRLSNLGYPCEDDPPEEMGPATIDALLRFQHDNDLEVTGKLDHKTVTRLREVHEMGVDS